MKNWIPAVTEEQLKENPHLHEDARVVIPTSEETEQIVKSMQTDRRCGKCKHYRHAQGQEEILNQDLWSELFTSMEHNPLWYGRLDMYGLCGASGGEYMTTAWSPAEVPKHFVDSDCSHAEKDESVDCPEYQEAGKWRRDLRVFQSGKAQFNTK